MKRTEIKKRDAFIIEHGAEHTWRELSDMFNVGEGTIHRVAKMYGVTLKKDEEAMRRGQELVKRIQKEKREAELYDKVRNRLPRFEYVGNYKPDGEKGTLDVRCKTCGTIKTIQTQALRHRQVRCNTCFKAEQEERKLKQKLEKERTRQIKEWASLEHDYEQTTFDIAICKECGKGFDHSKRNSMFCSDACTRKHNNRKKDKRIKPEQRIDKIELGELYAKYNGICYICGCKCDWEDYELKLGRDGRVVTVVGQSYPTIEHIKPLSKGGMHSWNNVALACKNCNDIKHAKWEE